jgi:hypothetical protein
MAIVISNDITEGLSGKFGSRFVFKQLRGKTIVARHHKHNGKESALQRDNRSRFKLATQYAKAMMLDPQKKAYYWKKAKKLKLPNAYTAAITDYMRKPKVDDLQVDVRRDVMTVKIHVLKKDFSIRSIKVSAINKDGATIETGRSPGNLQDWQYQFATDANSIAKVVAIVQDEPGNVVYRELLC